MSTRELQTGLASLDFARHMTLSLLDAIPTEHWFHIPIPAGNHAAWLAGHIAWEDDDCLNQLIDRHDSALPQSWHDRFATGSRSTPNAADYPEFADLRSQLAASRNELKAFFAASADHLDQPVSKQLHGFAKDLASFMHMIACHEMVHVGQLTVIRKSLKLPVVFA
ncbi:MAG: DinB family protein [Phycisphaerales bacterium]|nr:DinB family protein [Phycisphaerales bacterium]MCB9855230.1 DinB family protein [Phycisphaerales bacterium]MCB9862823.1 DinB family protein [Phycisphaerales bacterium]